MKIDGTNHTNFNPYKQYTQNQTEQKKGKQQLDQLEISDKAKQLQENQKPNAERTKYVQQIKQKIDSGDYQVDPQKTAQKMIDFFQTKK